MDGRLELRLLGAPAVVLDGVPVADLKSRKAQALLYFLAASDQPQPRSVLASLLWGDMPDTAAGHNLRKALSGLRASSLAPFLDLGRDTVTLQPAAGTWVDVREFERQAHSPQPSQWQQALSLYRGDFLAGFYVHEAPDFEHWALGERERLRELAMWTLHRLASDWSGRGEWAQAIAHLRRLLVLEPWREEAQRDLMWLLVHTGQRSAALAQYTLCRRALLEELDAEPSAETQALYEQIRAGQVEPSQDSALSVSASTQASSRSAGPDFPQRAGGVGSEVPSPDGVPAPLRHNLPAQLTSFVGQEAELAELAQHLATPAHRLLTLVGPGGIGKTRLAVQLASALLPIFADGVWLVELAPLADPALVLPAIATTFALRELPGITLLDLVANSLRTKRLLLILDNCEHLIEVCAQLADHLLRACPMMQILASSRGTLSIGGETVYRVPSLSVPDSAQLALDTLRQSEAVHLFVERAAAAQPRFTLSEHNAAAVVQICRQLDGIPLAIELAAARVRVLTAEQIAARLDDRFRLLTGGSRTALPRQQTLRALIDWSYDLLSEPERTLFRQLSVFASGWTIEALEAISCDLEVLELLAHLVDKSLVTADEQEGEARYHLLETVRQYGRDKLFERGEAAEVRDRHLAYYLQLAEAGEPHLRGPHQVRQLDQYAVEHDNFRAALQWGARRNTDAALRLAGTLAELWARRGYQTEGRTWLQALLDQVSALPELQGEAALRRRAAQAKALLGLSTMVFVAGDIAATLAARQASVHLYRQLEDRQGLGGALGVLGYAAMLRGDTAEAERALVEAISLGRETGDKLTLSFALGVQSRLLLAARGDLAAARAASAESARLARETGMPWATAQAVLGLADIAANAGHWEEARAHIREALALFGQLGDRYRFNATYSDLAHIERRAGNLEEAQRLYRQSIMVWQEFGQRAAIAHQLECFAFLARTQNQFSRAARLLGAAEALREVIGASMNSLERTEYDREVTALHAQMEAETDAAHWATGRAMTMEQAIAYALE